MVKPRREYSDARKEVRSATATSKCAATRTDGIMAAPLQRRRWRRWAPATGAYLSRRVKLTAVHFPFVLPVWLNIISPDETTWTPFVWETMDRNNARSLSRSRRADADTDLGSLPSTPRCSSVLPSSRREEILSGVSVFRHGEKSPQRRETSRTRTRRFIRREKNRRCRRRS